MAKSKKQVSPAEIEVRKQPWATDLSNRAVGYLAEKGIATEKAFVEADFGWGVSTRTETYIAPSIRSELEKRQYDLRVEKGLLDPKEPLTEKEVEEAIQCGYQYVLFDNFLMPFVSLGTHECCGLKPQRDYFFVLRYGSIGLEQIPKTLPKAYRTILCGFPSRVGSNYFSVHKRKGLEGSEIDIALTRQIFGLDYDSLKELAVGYRNAFFKNSPYSEKFTRICSSYSNNTCELTDNIIPKEFPYIAFHDNQHISIAGFYELISFLTDGINKDTTSFELLTSNGVTGSTWEALRNIQGVRSHLKAQWSDYALKHDE
jgi:hypothetical protein